MISRRLFLQSGAAAAAIRPGLGRTGRKRAGRHRHRDQDRSDRALQRPGLRLWRDRQDGSRLLPDDQRKGRRQRPQAQLSSAWTTAIARRRRWSRSRRLVEQEQVAFCFSALGTPTNPAIRNISTSTRCHNCSWPPVPASGATPSILRGRWAASRTIGPKRDIFAKHILKTKPDAKIGVLYQNDDFGKDYLIGLQGRSRADEAAHGGQGSHLRGYRPDHRLADRHASRLGRRRASHRRHAEIRRPGDPQGPRHRLEAGALLSTSRLRSATC